MNETVLAADISEGTAILLCKALEEHRNVTAAIVRHATAPYDTGCSVVTYDRSVVLIQDSLREWIAGFLIARRY